MTFLFNNRPGSKNAKPDALSRQHQPDAFSSQPENILTPTCIIGAVTWEVEEKVKRSLSKHPAPSSCPSGRLFVSASLRSQVLQSGHSSRLACHPGVRRTLALLRQRFWWPSMEGDTKGFIAACPTCSQYKGSHQAPSGLLQPLPIPHRPWSHISLDFVTGLPASHGNTVILTVVDRFSKIAHFIEFCTLLGAKVSLSSGFHPQTNGQAERMNQKMETALRCLTSRNPSSWSKHLLWIEYGSQGPLGPGVYLEMSTHLEAGSLCPSPLL